MRKEFAKILKHWLEKDSTITVLLGDISVGLFVDEHEELPLNVYNVGILEQSMISLAAGLSSSGNKVFVYTIASFIVERGYEQIKLDLCYNENDVVLVSANGPYDYNTLGPTHHSASDIPILWQLPKIDLLVPGRLTDVEEAFLYASNSGNPSYIRLTSRTSSITAEKLDILRRRESDTISIFVGEALKYYEDNEKLFISDRVYYLWNLKEKIKVKVDGAKRIKIYEPYSSPLLALQFISKSKEIEIESFCYPRSIESGVYERPTFDLVDNW